MITTSNFARTKNWLAACGKTPSPENLSTQIGVHIEEFAEFLSHVSIELAASSMTANLLIETTNALDAIGKTIKAGAARATIHDRKGALDALCDAEVTGNGVAYLADMGKEEADRRVLKANDDKMNPDGTPVILAGGKIGKREGWVAPDLSDLV